MIEYLINNPILTILWIALCFVLFRRIKIETKKFNEDKSKATRWPIAYHTVDIAVVKKSGGDYMLLLGQKHNQTVDNWRLPGGFTDPKLDISTEAAAIRELKEETNLTLNITVKDYAGSLRVDDPRYRDSEDKIISSLFIHFVEDGQESTIDLLAGDDLKEVRWLLINENLRSLTNPIHLPFVEEVIKRYDNKKVC